MPVCNFVEKTIRILDDPMVQSAIKEYLSDLHKLKTIPYVQDKDLDSNEIREKIIEHFQKVMPDELLVPAHKCTDDPQSDVLNDQTREYLVKLREDLSRPRVLIHEIRCDEKLGEFAADLVTVTYQVENELIIKHLDLRWKKTDAQGLHLVINPAASNTVIIQGMQFSPERLTKLAGVDTDPSV